MQIHPRIIKPLIISSPIIALIVAALTLSIQLSQIESKVLVLAKNEVKYFIKNIKIEPTLVEKKINLDDTSFLTITLLNDSNNIMMSQADRSYPTIIDELKKVDHSFTTRSTKEIQEHIIHNHFRNKFYFQFKVPVHIDNFDGYIQGLYQISDEELKGIYTNIAYSIVQLVLTIFVTTFLLYPIIVYLNKEYINQSKNLLQANLEIMSVLGGAVAKRDSETNAHNYRVTLYSIAFAEALHLNKEKIMGLIKGAFLHDVGKIGIADSILLKQGKLNVLEFEHMKYHVEFGIDIISKSKWLNDARDVVAYHHERHDGTGYSKNISGDQIPLTARIFMICDVFDALTSKRPYKKKFSFEKSINIIKEKAGTHFDPELVSTFCSIIEPLYTNISHLEDEENLKSMLDNKLHYLAS